MNIKIHIEKDALNLLQEENENDITVLLLFHSL